MKECVSHRKKGRQMARLETVSRMAAPPMSPQSTWRRQLKKSRRRWRKSIARTKEISCFFLCKGKKRQLLGWTRAGFGPVRPLARPRASRLRTDWRLNGPIFLARLGHASTRASSFGSSPCSARMGREGRRRRGHYRGDEEGREERTVVTPDLCGRRAVVEVVEEEKHQGGWTRSGRSGP